MRPNKPNQHKIIQLVMIGLGLLVSAYVLSTPWIQIPWGGADDTDNDGKIDVYWDGYKTVSPIYLLTR